MRLALGAAVCATALLFAPGAHPGGGSGITYSPANPTATTGVSFTVTAGGGNRNFASVAVSCDSGYATVLNVIVPAKGSGTSQIIYPPAGSCTATQDKEMQIGKARQLASVSFTVSP
jgi:hypothetical protein